MLQAVALDSVAKAVGALYLMIATDADCQRQIDATNAAARAGQPVIVEVAIDNSKRTAFPEDSRPSSVGQTRICGRSGPVVPTRRKGPRCSSASVATTRKGTVSLVRALPIPPE